MKNQTKAFSIIEHEADKQMIFIKKGKQILARINKADFETDKEASMVAQMISEIPYMLSDLNQLQEDYNEMKFIAEYLQNKLNELKNGKA